MISVRPISDADYEAWSNLYSPYAQLYQATQTQQMRDRGWSWLHDSEHEVSGLIATNDAGIAIGFAHYSAFARHLSASTWRLSR